MASTEGLDSPSTTTNNIVNEKPSSPKKHRFGRSEKNAAPSETASTSSAASTVEAKVEAPPPVPFSDLFRYSTKFELFLNAIGLVAAVAAGAAQVSFISNRHFTNSNQPSQPLLSLLFGNLTAGFVDFAKAINAVAVRRPLFSRFKSVSFQSIIGPKSNSPGRPGLDKCAESFQVSCRQQLPLSCLHWYCHVRCDLYLHAYLDIHRTSFSPFFCLCPHLFVFRVKSIQSEFVKNTFPQYYVRRLPISITWVQERLPLVFKQILISFNKVYPKKWPVSFHP